MTSVIFIGNLKNNFSKKILHEIFSSIGPCKVELKNNYGFVEYHTIKEAKEAIKKYNNTYLEGNNDFQKVRVELSRKIRALGENNYINNPLTNTAGKHEISLKEEKNYYNNKKEEKKYNLHNSYNNSQNNNNNTYNNKDNQNNNENNRVSNVCFICKLPGHFAKECVLTKDLCYECGEKGHMAKECQAGIREAEKLTYNRVKAVFSQKSAYKYMNSKQRILNILNFINYNHQ
jgi:hypothetical protein